MSDYFNGKFPIGAYFGSFCRTERYPDMPDVLNDESFALAKAGGFNFTISYTERYPETRADVLRALDTAHRHGMKVLVSDSNIEQGTIESKLMREGRLPAYKADYQTSADDYGSHPAFLGCYIVDEPLPPRFPLLADIRKAFNKVTPDNLFFVNMLPVYGISAMKGEFWIEDDYERERVYTKYIEGYLATVKPPLLCYDYYPFEREYPNFGTDYFVNLAVARRAAMKAKIPLWVSPQAASQGNMRALNEGEMMMQVNTSLAFGAKGLVYFCWSMPYDGMCGQERYREALTDRGIPMPMYYMAQAANAWVRKIEKYLLNARSLGVVAVGTSPARIPDFALAKDRGSLKSVHGKHVLVGVLQNGEGKYAYLAVNNSIQEEDEVCVAIEGKFVCTSEDACKSGQNEMTVRLQAGRAVFIQCE